MNHKHSLMIRLVFSTVSIIKLRKILFYRYVIYSSHSKGHNLVTDLSMVPCPTWAFATRTRPSVPGNTSRALLSGQLPLDVSGETTRTTSPTWTSRRSCFHFFLGPSPGSHSRSYRCQKCRTSSWIRRHRFRTLNCIVSTDVGAN